MTAARIGEYAIDRVVELERPLFGAREFFPELTEDMLATCRAELPPGHITGDGMLLMSSHTFVVRTGRCTILIDTCGGNDKERPARPIFHRMQTNFLGELASAG